MTADINHHHEPHSVTLHKRLYKGNVKTLANILVSLGYFFLVVGGLIDSKYILLCVLTIPRDAGCASSTTTCTSKQAILTRCVAPAVRPNPRKNCPTVTRHLHTISRLTRDLGTSYSHHERQGPESGPLMAARGLENAPLVALAERGPRELHEEQRTPSAPARLLLIFRACREVGVRSKDQWQTARPYSSLPVEIIAREHCCEWR